MRNCVLTGVCSLIVPLFLGIPIQTLAIMEIAHSSPEQIARAERAWVLGADLMFYCILTVLAIIIYTVYIYTKSQTLKQNKSISWLVDLSVILGWLSAVSLVGFALNTIITRLVTNSWSLDSLPSYFWFYLPLPGAVMAAVAVLLGLIAHKRELHSSIQGIVLGVVTIAVFTLFLIFTTMLHDLSVDLPLLLTAMTKGGFVTNVIIIGLQILHLAP
jgi:hypothetical protein